MTAARPQPHFDDLYTAVYGLIDDAKSRHNVIKLYKGSHASADPHPVVLDYGQFFAAHRRGVLGYACHIANPGADRYSVTDLDEFDRRAAPRVSTRQVFTIAAPGASSTSPWSTTQTAACCPGFAPARSPARCSTTTVAIPTTRLGWWPMTSTLVPTCAQR